MTKGLLTMAVVLFAPALFAQEFDFKTLDKVGAKAKSNTNITLDADTLKMMSGFFGGRDSGKDGDALKSIGASLKAIYVRNYEYDKAGQYSVSDLNPLRDYLKQGGWKSIVDTHEGDEWTQVFMQPSPDGKLAGLAVVSTEEKEVTVVYISGDFAMSDLSKLSGNMGIPDLSGVPGVKSGANQNKNKK